MDNPSNARIFESVDGLLAVSALLRDSETSRAVKTAALEFLRFYLLPEDSSVVKEDSVLESGGGYSVETARHMSRSNIQGGSNGSNKSKGSTSSGGSNVSQLTILELSTLDGCGLRTPKEKTKLLGKYLDNAEDIAEQFDSQKIFQTII
jgi:hypothetical protein